MARERGNKSRGVAVNSSIIGHGNVRNGVVQTGAVALLLGAALATSGVHAAENVEREDVVVAPEAPAAPPRAAIPPAPAAPAAPAKPGERATDRRSAAERRADREETDARMRDAQERLNRAAAEIAAIASERAAEAMAKLPWLDDWSRRTVIGVQLSPEGRDGAKVMEVSPGGPAELAGVRAGDVITMVNGKAVKGDGAREVVRLLRGVEPESKVKLRVLRDGRTKDFEVVARPFSAEAFVHRGDPPPGVDGDAFRGPFGPFNFQFSPRGDLAGLEVTTLTPQLGRYFGTEKGVLVVRAPKGDIFKLQDGDVIVSIDGREPTSGSHITRILSSYQPGEQLTMRILRDRKPQELVVKLPEDDRRARLRTTWIGEPL